MIGARGTPFTSKTLWRDNEARIDVENPNPGKRPGQIHYHDAAGKYIYDIDAKHFRDLGAAENDLLLANPEVQAAINKGLKYLGED